MDTLRISGDVLRDINQVVTWLEQSGYPARTRDDQYWSGPNWAIRQQVKKHHSYPVYEIQIQDAALMNSFLHRWG